MEASNRNLKLLREVKELLPKYKKQKKRSQLSAAKAKVMRERIVSKLGKITANEGALYAEDIEKIIMNL